MRELNEQELNRVVGGVSHHGKKHVASSAASSANVADSKLKKHCIPTPPIVLPDSKSL
ncbi:MAG: hypothetical protein M3Y39_19150 [Chloroflexota bacterium]|nr:hypothetical protein [Chloroflexota bacterium]